ncbi:MAG: BrnT family toxin [Campylobacterota bacterium]|nr:BrnT family toxin [Campylobacterota bacterium]
MDYKFSYFEERWITIGSIQQHKILVVANLFFTDDSKEIIRIISARKANEKSSYEKY